jgi:diketogulonate reductase-like aldo/keto reductase
MAATAIAGRLSLTSPHLPHVAQAIPALIYGTAWKKDATADLVYQALSAGFTGIDTANQPKHYQEHLVGSGIRKALQDGQVKRNDIYLQTKFTAVPGQDLINIPYNPKDSISIQVQESVHSSLQHLRSAGDHFDDIEGSYIDTLVLHSPMPTIAETMEVWETLEAFVPDKIRNLGVSNCNLFTLMDIYERASIKPAVVQNRFYPATKFDIGLRKFCREKSIIYQSFWTLTANPNLVWSVEVGQLANRLSISPQAALYCLVLGLGNTVVLNGTKQDERMKSDLNAVQNVRIFSEEHPDDWNNMLQAFKKLVGDPVG